MLWGLVPPAMVVRILPLATSTTSHAFGVGVGPHHGVAQQVIREHRAAAVGTAVAAVADVEHVGRGTGGGASDVGRLREADRLDQPLAVVHVVDVDRVGREDVLVMLRPGGGGGRGLRGGRLLRVIPRGVVGIDRVAVGTRRGQAAVGVARRGRCGVSYHAAVAPDRVAGDADIVGRRRPGQVDLVGTDGRRGEPGGLRGRSRIGGARVGGVEGGLLGVGAGRAEGVAGSGGVGVGVVVARSGHAVVAEARDVARRAGDDADPVVPRGEFHRGGEDEVIPARRVRAFERQLF